MHRNDTGLSVQRVPMFPEGLSADEQAHTARMRECITHEIAAAGGWLGFERYMELALYAPGLGYYSAGARKLGPGGDFTTAPEISRLFGACLARQCADVLSHLVRGSILELGAGTGRLAVDVLSRLDSLGHLPVRYLILDVSAELRERQAALIREALPHLVERVVWLDAPPRSFDGVILANEVADALPVARFRWQRALVEELGIAIDAGRFVEAPRPASRRMAEHCNALVAEARQAYPGRYSDEAWHGYVSEYCPRLKPWAVDIARGLNRGALLWFDYGLPRAQYYVPERHEGTLLCHFRQRAHADFFLYPGLQDITAWVDFSVLAEACHAAGCELAGFTTQAFFLAALQIDTEMRELAGGDANRFARLAMEARQLMLPGEMGERFKTMAWTRGLDRELAGFALHDMRHAL